jgi:hypothetical protein
MLECVAANRAGSPDCFASSSCSENAFIATDVLALVAVGPSKQDQGVGRLSAVAGRLVKLQRRLEMRDRLIERALLGTQAAKA